MFAPTHRYALLSALVGQIFWAFSTLPSVFFCSSPHDPCSCTGGSFEILKSFCNASISGNTSALSNKNLEFTKNAAKREYVGVFESLENSSTTIIVTVVIIIIVALVFAVARSQLLATAVQRDRDEIEEQRVQLLEQNKRIQKQLSLNLPTEIQTKIVHAGTAALEAEVPAKFKISSKQITFELLLGSGSFGDCYKGYLYNRPVAVKQMRVVSCGRW